MIIKNSSRKIWQLGVIASIFDKISDIFGSVSSAAYVMGNDQAHLS
ncbi:MAG: hypothetical protein IIZ53_04195 [Ruminococcus sp.]|jgi:hypothetical protein|nr:hypothetical protein [Ruminococcus sp.]